MAKRFDPTEEEDEKIIELGDSEYILIAELRKMINLGLKYITTEGANTLPKGLNYDKLMGHIMYSIILGDKVFVDRTNELCESLPDESISNIINIMKNSLNYSMSKYKQNKDYYYVIKNRNMKLIILLDRILEEKRQLKTELIVLDKSNN